MTQSGSSWGEFLVTNYRDQAEDLLRQAEDAAASQDGPTHAMLTGVVGLGYAMLSHLDAVTASEAEQFGDFVADAQREGFMHELLAIFADTIRNDVSPAKRTALTLRFNREVRERLGW